MKPVPHHPMLARAAGMPIFGKRTESLKTSESALTKQLAQQKAEAAGFANTGDWLHSLVIREVHGVTVTRVFLWSKESNCANSGERNV